MDFELRVILDAPIPAIGKCPMVETVLTTLSTDSSQNSKRCFLHSLFFKTNI